MLLRFHAFAFALTAVSCTVSSYAQSIDDGIAAMAVGQNEKAVATFRAIDSREAQHNLGVLAESGRFVGCDPLYCASDWYLKSARQGLVEGMAAVGRLNYNNGHPKIGVEWLSLAEKNGSADARQMLAQVERQQVALAQQHAQQEQATRQLQAQAANNLGFLLGCAIAGGGCGTSPSQPLTTYSGEHGTATLSSRRSNGFQTECGYVTPSRRVTVVVSGSCPDTYAY